MKTITTLITLTLILSLPAIGTAVEAWPCGTKGAVIGHDPADTAAKQMQVKPIADFFEHRFKDPSSQFHFADFRKSPPTSDLHYVSQFKQALADDMITGSKWVEHLREAVKNAATGDRTLAPEDLTFSFCTLTQPKNRYVEMEEVSYDFDGMPRVRGEDERVSTIMVLLVGFKSSSSRFQVAECYALLHQATLRKGSLGITAVLLLWTKVDTITSSQK